MARKRGASRELITLRQADVLRMKTVERLNFRQIAEQLGISSTQAYRDFITALRDTVPAEEVAEARRAELLKLDALEQEAMAILRSEHPLVNRGRIVKDDQGRVITDSRPRLSAIDRLLVIGRQRALLMGLNAPSPIAILTQEVVTSELRVQARDLGLDLDAVRDAVQQAVAQIGA